MRSILTQAHYSLIAFAAADKSNGSGDAPTGDESTEAPAEVNEPLTIHTEEAVLDSIGKAMRSREVFPTVEAAVTKLQNVIAATQPKNDKGEAIEDAPVLFGIPVKIKGADSEGNIDESVYEGHRAALAYVGARVESGPKGKAVTGIKAIVIFPVPTVEEFAESEKGKAWLDKIVEKEAAHVFFRNLRDATTTVELSNGMVKAPATVDEFVTEYSRGGGLDTDTFDALWPSLRKSMVAKMPALAKLLPAKNIVLNAIRSKAYAETNPDTAALEGKDMFAKIGLALVSAAQANTVNGQPSPLPTDAIESWLAERDTFTIAERATEAKDFSVLDAMKLDF